MLLAVEAIFMKLLFCHTQEFNLFCVIKFNYTVITTSCTFYETKI